MFENLSPETQEILGMGAMVFILMFGAVFGQLRHEEAEKRRWVKDYITRCTTGKWPDA